MDELKRYKKRQHRLFGEFLHEIKTPLAILRTHLETEITNDRLPFEVRKKLVLDVEEIARVNQLIQDMRILLDDEYQELRRDFVSQSLLEIVMDVIETLQPVAEHKQQRITLVCEENINIVMHPHKLKQLFFNLIMNAIKYSSKESEVSVFIEITALKVCVSVKDEGIGIAAEEKIKIFEPFYRIDDSACEGKGLGLAVSMAIAQLHDTTIELESEVNKGSHFTICFKR